MPINLQPRFDSSRSNPQEDVKNQLRPIIWKTISSWHVVPPTCPQGLEYLSLIDKVFIVDNANGQETRIANDFCSHYVQCTDGQVILGAYGVAEGDMDGKSKLSRYKELSLLDCNDKSIIQISQEGYKPNVFCWLFGWKNYKLDVCSPPGTVIGRIQRNNSNSADYCISDPKGNLKLRITDSNNYVDQQQAIRREYAYQIRRSPNNEFIGFINRRNNIANGKRNTLEISFPNELNIRLKAMILGMAVAVQL